MLLFDAPTRERCTVRRESTSTPLQALVLMNDPTYVEAARHLAERMLKESDGSAIDRLRHGFRLALSRDPTTSEATVLFELLQRQKERFAGDAATGQALLASGESPRDESLDISEQAAYTIVASVLLNLDETISKP
jgi:hypothetical protein